MKNNIKQVIEKIGITQKELAERIGMTEPGLSKAINGSANSETIKKVADALNVTPESLIDNSDLYAEYSSGNTPLVLGNIQLDCYVLNNGQRVFSGRGVARALGSTSQSGDWLKRFVSSDELQPFLSNDDGGIIEKIYNPIEFKRKDAGGAQTKTYGHEATLIIDLCSSILDANDAGLTINQSIVDRAAVIIRSVAKVGIIALIDEATGYDKVKTNAIRKLQTFLNEFLNEEASRWVKKFDDEFFEDLYKMHNWSWTKTAKRPGVVGTWINDLVYQRMGPMVLTELQDRNPIISTGRRRYKHHQFLSDETGTPALRKHLASLHTLALASNFQWVLFKKLVNRVHPLQEQQLELFEDMDI